MADVDVEQPPSQEENTIDPPAVLNVNSSSSTSASLTTTTESVPSTNREEMVESTGAEPKDVPATIPGLTEMINEWQISSIPEEQQFFSTSQNVFDAAVRGIKSHFGEADSEIKRAWLLTEIDHWDLEKERIVVLTNSNLVVVKYNFIQQLVEELKYIPLGAIKKISVGNFKYSYSYGFSRPGAGIKIWWGNDPLNFSTKWNPFSSTVPYTIITSHILIRRNKSENPILKHETLPELLDQAVKEFHSRAPSGASPDIPLVEEDIEFDYYLGLSAMIHNHSFLGFFKKRGAVNW